MKDEEVFGLLKVPDEVIIKELRIKLGIANATIDELSYELDLLKSSTVRDLVTKIKSLKGTIKSLVSERKNDVYFKKYQEQKKECNRLMKANSELVGKLYQLKLKMERNNL